MPDITPYNSQAARDAQQAGYDDGYCEYLEWAAHDHHALYTRLGDPAKASEMLTRTLSEALMGNDGD